MLFLFAFMFVGVLVVPAHAYSETEIAENQTTISAASSGTITLSQVNIGDLMVIQATCVSGTLVNSQTGQTYAWNEEYGVSTITDSNSQNWSSAGLGELTATHEVISTWYTQSTATGFTTYTVHFSSTIGYCDVFVGEWNTEFTNLVNIQNFQTSLASCTISTNTMATGACASTVGTVSTLAPNAPNGALIIALGVADCQSSIGSGANWTLTGAGQQNSENCTVQGSASYVLNSAIPPPAFTYYFNAQSDSSSSDYYATVPCGGALCYQYSRAISVGFWMFALSGQAELIQGSTNVLGCAGPTTTWSNPLAEFPFYYLGTTGPQGLLLQNEGFYLNTTETGDSLVGTALVSMALYAGAAGSANYAISGTNQLSIIPSSLVTFNVTSSSLSGVYLAAEQISLPVNAWIAVGFNWVYGSDSAGYLYVYEGQASDAAYSSAVTHTTTFPPSLNTLYVGEPSFCFAATTQSVGVSIYQVRTITTNTITTTCIVDCTTITETAYVTQTQTQEVNDPNMSALNYWLIPMLVIFVPFLLVMAVFVQTSRVIDPDVLLPVGLMTIALTGWLGYAWSAFVPIYIPVAFTMLLFADRWRNGG